MALAHRSGQRYEELVRVRVIDPLDLHDAAFHPTEAMASCPAQGHAPSLKPVPALDLGIFAAAGGLFSTPRDMSRFAAAIPSRLECSYQQVDARSADHIR